MSADERWSLVDGYFARELKASGEALDAALAASKAAGLPEIQVSAVQGKLLYLLARMRGARNILEIGTLGGYSTIWLARALPDGGRLDTLEFDPLHAKVAAANIEHAGLAGKVKVHVGPALQTLPTLEKSAPYDLTFIDADKVSTPAYFEWAIRLSRPGSVIIVDNVVRDGKVASDHPSDANVCAVREFISSAGKDPRVSVTAIQTVGSKGYDGFALAVVNG